jgi:hypothetical protein
VVSGRTNPAGMIPLASRPPTPSPGGRPLDPDRPTSDEPRPAPRPAPPTPAPPPGLKRQAGATKDALLGLVRAHIDLAKAEATEIGDEIRVVAAGAGIAFGALVLIAFLVPIGTALFLGEWLFGSLGWGVLHGTGFLLVLAVGAVLAVLHAGRVARSLVLAFLAGVLVAVLFGTNAPNTLYRAIADQFGTAPDPGPIVYGVGALVGAVVVGILGLIAGARNGTAGDAFRGLIGGAIIGALLGVLAGGIVRLAVDEGSRPMVVGLLIGGAILALVGLVVGVRSRDAGNAIAGLVAGFAIGGALGAFSAITFTWHVAIAVGITAWFALALALMAAEVAANGIDTEALKQRFYPQTTIDTAKETIEWAKARIPRGPAS